MIWVAGNALNVDLSITHGEVNVIRLDCELEPLAELRKQLYPVI